MGFLKELGKIGGDILNGVTSGIPGMIVGAGSSLIGGAISDMFSDGNQQQAQQWNEKQFEEQKKFWYEQQEYNSPENQVNRLREAGINPQLALGNIQSGQMGSLPSTPTMGANPVNLGNINNAISGLLDYNLKKAVNVETVKGLELDNEAKDIDNRTRAIENLFRLFDIMSGVNYKDEQTRKTYYDTEIARAMAMPQIAKIFSEIENNASITAINTLNFVSGLVELRYLPQMKQIEYAEKMAEIAKMNAETETEKQRKITEIQRTNNEYFGWKGKKVVNSLNEQLVPLLVEEKGLENTLNSRTLDAKVEQEIQKTLPDDYKHPKGSRNFFDNRKRGYGQYPD